MILSPESQIDAVLKKGQFPGSWLIVGPFGVGKRAFAKRLASFLLTGNWNKDTSSWPDVKWIERDYTDDAKKEIQKTILAGKSVDADEFKDERKSEITIDTIREGLKFLSVKSTGGAKRILIVNLADEMNENAANAILKALEEPSPDTVILLLCENMGKLLPTIRSRCRKITMRPLTYKQTVKKITEVLPACTDPEFLAELSNGSIGMAQMIEENNGVALYRQIQSFVQPSMKINVEKLNGFAESLAKDEKTFALFKYFMSDMMMKRTKDAALERNPMAEAWDELYQTTHRLFIDTQNLYLDKRQMVINIFLNMGKII